MKHMVLVEKVVSLRHNIYNTCYIAGDSNECNVIINENALEGSDVVENAVYSAGIS